MKRPLGGLWRRWGGKARERNAPISDFGMNGERRAPGKPGGEAGGNPAEARPAFSVTRWLPAVFIRILLSCGEEAGERLGREACVFLQETRV